MTHDSKERSSTQLLALHSLIQAHTYAWYTRLVHRCCVTLNKCDITIVIIGEKEQAKMALHHHHSQVHEYGYCARVSNSREIFITTIIMVWDILT